MDRKIKTPDKDKYAHIPTRHKWLYHLSDYSVGRILLWFVGALLVVLAGTFLVVKLIVRYTR